MTTQQAPFNTTAELIAFICDADKAETERSKQLRREYTAEMLSAMCEG